MTLSSRILLLSWPLATVVLFSCVFSASANEDCLWYTDRNGSMHSGFDCPFFMFCCGDCYRRRCCADPFKMITEREQKQCVVLHFGPKTIAGIASAVLLFLAIVATIICCFMCSCCYLYQRRQQSRTPFEERSVQMTDYPDQSKPGASPFYPESQGYSGVPTYPMNAPPNQPYPQQNQPYPPQNQPYPPQNAPYPPQNAPYPPQNAPCPPQNAPYPPQNAPYQPVYNPAAPPPYVP